MSVEALASRPDRTGCDAGISADLELVLHELLESALVVDDEHEIDRLHADLRADAAAGDGEKCRRRPAAGLLVADAEDAAAALPADAEAALEQRREHRDAFRLLHDRARHRLVGRCHDLFEHRRRLGDALDFVFGLLRDKRRERSPRR